MANGRLTFYGHAFFSITTATQKVILIDPWVVENPLCPITLDDLERADLVLVTHDHFDHVGQTGEILRKTGATLVANVETASRIMRDEQIPQTQVLNGGFGLNIGATAPVDGVEITMTQAFHSSGTGAPTGYIVRLENGWSIYHAGDTGLFESMGTLGRTHGIDMALLPIGNVFTMDPVQAVAAVGLIQPKVVVPMHYQSFPILTPSADGFAKELGRVHPGVRVLPLKPGEGVDLNF